MRTEQRRELDESQVSAYESAKIFRGSYAWPRPIPVDVRLPEMYEPVLCFIPGLCRTVFGGSPRRSPPGVWERLELHADGWWQRYGTQVRQSDVSHWLPLPARPEQMMDSGISTYTSKSSASTSVSDLRWEVLKYSLSVSSRDFGRGVMTASEMAAYKRAISDMCSTVDQIESLIQE